MSSWRIFSSLCLLVASIPLSRPNCWEYFDMRSWGGGNLTLDFPLVDADRPNNRLLCTLWKACETFETSKNVSLAHLCSMYYHCFDTKDFDKSSCQQQTSQRISFYHLMCLSANVLATSPEEAPPGCRFDPVCDLYSQVTPSVVDQTKTPPTVSTTTPKSTETTTGLTPPPPTTTTTTTAAVTAAAAVTPYSSSSSSSSSRLHTTAVISNGQSLKVDGAGGGATLILYLLLMAFVLLVLLALLAFMAAVWFCRRMRGQSQEQNVSERGPETVCLDKSVEGLGCDHF